MPATIQTIEKPLRARAWDTSGNNNHGQIYSGRALEFDGLSDYINITSDGTSKVWATGSWTLSFWYNPRNVDTGRMSIVGGSGSYSPKFLSLYPEPGGFTGLAIYDYGASAWLYSDTHQKVNTWYRGVVVHDGNQNITFYQNGVADGTVVLTGSTSQNDLGLGTIGKIDLSGSEGDRLFDGWMSDFQIWDAAWTASDALFDYQNPEQLALNNSSTSLTESNLKLWYPMNDGHRGQQSYILDASNTGLSDELLTNGDFSESAVNPATGTHAGWYFSTPSNGQASISDGKLTLSINNTGGSNADRNPWVHQDITVLGETYKCTVDIDSQTADDFDLKLEAHGATPTYKTDLGPGIHEFYFTASTDTRLVFRLANNISPSGTGSVTINSISVKAVNHKNHGTTVFYGDEQISATNDRTFAGASSWTNATGNNALEGYDEETGGQLTISPTDESYVKYAYLDGANWEVATGNAPAMVAGRRYRLSYDIHVSAYTKGTLSVGLSNDATPAVMSSAKNDYTATNGSGQTGQYVDFNYVAADHERIAVYAAANTVLTADFDNFSIKEIGTATGWTDADQQLTIPQTALQSYNQLMWFDGVADCVQTDPSGTIWNATNGQWNSVSCWVYKNTGNNNGMYWSVEGSAPNLYFTTSGSDYRIGYNTGNGEVFGIQTAKTNLDGKWHHWVMNWKRNSNSDDTAISSSDVELFLDGEKQSIDYQGLTTDSNAADTAVTSDINFMCNQAADNQFVNGTITEISTWTDQLTLAEVEELYNDGKALDALTHSNVANLTAYWRNNGLAAWTQLKGSNGGSPSPTSGAETMLITAGADTSRDSQGFIMNRQRTTSSLNLYNNNGMSDGQWSHAKVLSKGDDIFAFAGASEKLTISCWFKVYDVASTAQMIISRNDNIDGWRLQIESSANKISFETEKDNTITACKSNSAVVANTWYHVVGFYNSTTNFMALYVDGTVQSDVEISVTTMDASSARDGVFIGMHQSNGLDEGFFGEIDDLCIYNGLGLSLTDVKRNHKAGKRSHPNPS